jgi:hypothetical protein
MASTDSVAGNTGLPKAPCCKPIQPLTSCSCQMMDGAQAEGMKDTREDARAGRTARVKQGCSIHTP